MADDNSFHLFNLNTMSGIHPGSRTQRTHIVRLAAMTSTAPTPREPTPGEPTPGERPTSWARILWPEGEGAALYRQADGSSWQPQPFLAVHDAEGERAFSRLRDALAGAGEEPLACGVCRWWQPLADRVGPDGLAVGRCGWGTDGPVLSAGEEREQSALALACPHWETGAQPAPLSVEDPARTPTPSPAHKSGWWSNLRRRLSGQKAESEENRAASPLAERSGVGAGTERCLACHGRIANLGALTVAAESDDKRTLSVWRCRLCRTFYLNDWIDRWERLDSLETEESYYRIAPDEAFSLLDLFRRTRGGEHPGGRQSRTEQRAQMDRFVAGRPRLLHQIKQGR